MSSRRRTPRFLGAVAAISATAAFFAPGAQVQAAEYATPESALARAVRSNGTAYLAARDAAASEATESEIAASETGGGRLEIAARAVRLLKYRRPTYLDLQLRIERLLLVQERQQKKSDISFFALSGLLSPEAVVLLAERLLFEERSPGAPSAFWTGAPANVGATPPPDAARTRDVAARSLGVLKDQPLGELALIEAVRTEPPSPLRDGIAAALARRATPALESRLRELADGASNADEAAWLREVARRVGEALPTREAEAH